MAKKRSSSGLFALQAALSDPRLTKLDVLILAALVEMTSADRGFAWPSLEFLAAATGVDKRSVRRSLRRLEESPHIVETVTGGGREQTSRYVVRTDRYPVSPLGARIRQVADEMAQQRAAAVDGETRTGESGFSDSVRAKPEPRNPDSSVRKPGQFGPQNPDSTVPRYPMTGIPMNESPSDLRSGSPGGDHHSERAQIGREVAITERRVKALTARCAQVGYLTHGDLAELRSISDRLGRISEQHPHHSGDVGGWAWAVCEDARDLLDQYGEG